MKVSVCIITYNHDEYIVQAVKSVLRQEVDFQYEIIVGEDCSTDDTRERLYTHFADRDNMTILAHEDNLGTRQNMQAVLRAARGEYVAILDGDDFWTDEQKLQKQVDILDTHPEYSMVGHQYRSVFENGPESGHGPDVSPEQPARITMEDFLKGVWIGAGTMVYRRECVPQLPEWAEGIPTGDKIFQFTCLLYGPIYFLNEVMSAYRVHDDGMFGAADMVKRLKWVIAYMKAFDTILDGTHRDIIFDTLAKKHYLLSYIHECEKQYAEADAAFYEAWQYDASKSRRLLEAGRRVVRKLRRAREHVSYAFQAG